MTDGATVAITRLLDAAEVDTAIAQLVSEAVVSEGVIDVYAAAGIDNPELSILSDEFLAEVQQMEKKNLALAIVVGAMFIAIGQIVAAAIHG